MKNEFSEIQKAIKNIEKKSKNCYEFVETTNAKGRKRYIAIDYIDAYESLTKKLRTLYGRHVAKENNHKRLSLSEQLEQLNNFQKEEKVLLSAQSNEEVKPHLIFNYLATSNTKMGIDLEDQGYVPEKYRCSRRSNPVIKICNQIKDKALSFMSNKKSTISRKVEWFQIISSRKPKNKQKMKFNLIQTTVAVALSLVTSLTIFGVSKSLLNRKDNDIATENSNIEVKDDVIRSKSNNDEKSCDLLLNSDQLKGIYSPNIIENNKSYKPIDNNITDYPKKSEEETDVHHKKNEGKTDVDPNENEQVTENAYDIMIGDIVNVSPDSKIYDNIYDAASETNGLNRSISSNTTRYIEYIGFENNGQVVYSSSEEEINTLKNNGNKVVAVGVSVLKDGDCEGFYNNDDVKVLSKKR